MAAKESKAPRIAKGAVKSNPGGKLKGGAPKGAGSHKGTPYYPPIKKAASPAKQKAPYSITTPKN